MIGRATSEWKEVDTVELRRRRLTVWLAAVAAAVVAVALAWWAVSTAVTFFRYPYAAQRAAAAYLDDVDVRGFEYLGEDTTDDNALSRYWIRHGAIAADLASTTVYNSRLLRTDYPTGGPIQSRFEEELGWLALPDHCSLHALHVIELRAGTLIGVSLETVQAVQAGEATVINVVVICGLG